MFQIALTNDIEAKSKGVVDNLEKRYIQIFKNHENEKEELRKKNEKLKYVNLIS